MGFYSGMFSVFVILIKYLLQIFASLCFSAIERFVSISVMFWSYCKPFSLKSGLQSFQRFSSFILSSVEIQLLRKVFFSFLFSFKTRFWCFLYAFRSSYFPFLFALFLSLDLVIISCHGHDFSNKRSYVRFIISSKYSFFKRSYCI